MKNETWRPFSPQGRPAFLLVGLVFLVAFPAAAAPVADASSSASARPASSGSARPLSSAEQTKPPPPGHPPATEGTEGTEGGDSVPTVTEPSGPPKSESHEDAGLPPGTIVVEVRDARGAPVPQVDLTLGILRQSVAQGESRERRSARSDPQGNVTFSSLEGVTSTAYRISTVREGATFAATPFQLPLTGGVRVTLRVFPVVRDVRATSIAVQGFAYIEPRDEVFQIEVAYRIYNFGLSAWVASDVEVDLPVGFKAFTAQKAMSDLGWDVAAGKGVRFRGTVLPGEQEAAFRFQVPYDGGDAFRATLGMLPNVQSFRIAVDAPPGMTLSAEGFSAAQPTFNTNGQRVLLVERSANRSDQLFRQAYVRLDHLPTRPIGRWIAVIAAFTALVAGVYAFRVLPASLTRGGQPAGASEKAKKEERQRLEQTRQQLFKEIERLEEARTKDEIGPKTYERLRQEIIDAIASIITQLDRLKISPTEQAARTVPRTAKARG